jgi:hypothetical protein
VSGPPAARPTTAEVAPPRSPLFTARTDESAGVIRARGHLDRVGVDALSRTVTALRRLGHRLVVVQLGSVTIADDALGLLDDLAARMSDGVRLEYPATVRPGGSAREPGA